MMSIHDIPGFFTLEETQVDLAPDQTQALVASVLDAFSEWLETPVPKELPTTARTLGTWMADEVYGQLRRNHRDTLPNLAYRMSRSRQGIITFTPELYAFRTKLAVTRDVRVRDTGTRANWAYNDQLPLVDTSGKPLPPRRLNLAYRLDDIWRIIEGIYLTFGQVRKVPLWIWQLYGVSIHPHPVHQGVAVDSRSGEVAYYTTYCPPGVRLA